MIHIHAPAPVRRLCVVIDCPTCQRQRRAFAAIFEWYGASVTCAGCGDQWHDGEMAPRPFAPGWRQRSINHARQQLAQIGAQA